MEEKKVENPKAFFNLMPMNSGTDSRNIQEELDNYSEVDQIPDIMNSYED